MYTDLEELYEKIRVEREKLEEIAGPVVERGECLGKNEDVLKQSWLVDELLVQELELLKRMKEQDK